MTPDDIRVVVDTLGRKGLIIRVSNGSYVSGDIVDWTTGAVKVREPYSDGSGNADWYVALQHIVLIRKAKP